MTAIEYNIGNLLSVAWPDESTSSEAAPVTDNNQSPDAIRLLYAGKMDQDPEHRVARGVDQCVAKPTEKFTTLPMWLTTGSSLTRSVIQLAVWEWVSMRMVLAMLMSTLTFNGFFNKQLSGDSYPRLVIILIYIASFILHAWYVWKSCRSFFTAVAAGSSWSLLHKASFVSVDLRQLQH